MYQATCYEARSVNLSSLFMQHTSVCICGGVFTLTLCVHVLITNTSIVKCPLRGPHACHFSHIPFVSASPSACLLCLAAFSLSTGQKSMKDWCRTSDPPSHRPCGQTKGKGKLHFRWSSEEFLNLLLFSKKIYSM